MKKYINVVLVLDNGTITETGFVNFSDSNLIELSQFKWLYYFVAYIK